MLTAIEYMTIFVIKLDKMIIMKGLCRSIHWSQSLRSNATYKMWWQKEAISIKNTRSIIACYNREETTTELSAAFMSVCAFYSVRNGISLELWRLTKKCSSYSQAYTYIAHWSTSSYSCNGTLRRKNITVAVVAKKVSWMNCKQNGNVVV